MQAFQTSAPKPPEGGTKLSRLSAPSAGRSTVRCSTTRNQVLSLDERRNIYEGLVDPSLQRQ